MKYVIASTKNASYYICSVNYEHFDKNGIPHLTTRLSEATRFLSLETAMNVFNKYPKHRGDFYILVYECELERIVARMEYNPAEDI